MATQNIQPIRPYRDTSGGPPFRQSMQEAATQTFKTGAVLVKAANGRLQEGSTDPAQILGVAEEDGHNVTTPGLTDIIHFAGALDDTLFVGNVSTGQVTSLILDIGARYGLTKVGDNWTIDKTKIGTSARVIIIDFDPRDTIGDTQGRLLFRFMANFTAYGSTS